MLTTAPEVINCGATFPGTSAVQTTTSDDSVCCAMRACSAAMKAGLISRA